MKTDTVAQVIRDRGQLAQALEAELGFYRALYVLLDRQRDRLVNGRDQDMAADFTELEGLQQQIETSEHQIAHVRTALPSQLQEWSRSPEVVGVVDKIRDMIGRCREIVGDCQRLAGERLTSYRRELDAMGQGRRMLAGMTMVEATPRFLDQRP